MQLIGLQQEGGIRSSVGGLKVAVAQSRSSKARGEGGLRTFGRSTVPPTLGAQLDDELNEQIGRCLRSLTETALTAGISMTRYQPAFGALVELVNARERRGLRYSAREVFEAFSRGLQTVLSSERNRRLLETSFADLIEELARGALVLPRPV
uniref:Uncharacterized protein n=1 Tax=Chromera velia CCMP2878 TaxID=1169474 RepID=A0A0G4FF28_9ALVE|eukprot:Cvel_16618.t1-p1 / transcript=Cvel_16618.t1 / gene=Cvel_16618 / organism=Chromera_velia_CCMP2878 / gene_product=hypothetical protein / transcript_product=hypothetical protein / location=Cvel_scaffold1288:4488-5139(-) / protein_length=151 / sequence_SO=supercontig / SO=protein_coding / is_pseudo=false